MISITSDGWLEGVRRIDSPNFNSRQDNEVSLLVVHNISLPPGCFGGGHIDRFFCNQLDTQAHPYFAEIGHLRVSAHCLLGRGGSVVQFVSFDDRAWHAGRSVYQGRPECNDYSVGIELEGADDVAYTDLQYRSLAKIALLLMRRYPQMTKERITGHRDIAPGRKTDPGDAFDWAYFKSLL